jgi:hypothetical protein
MYTPSNKKYSLKITNDLYDTYGYKNQNSITIFPKKSMSYTTETAAVAASK